MTTETVRLDGFRELERALSELPKSMGRNVLRRVARGALEPMADDAAAKAPERTGQLSFSISVSEKRTSRAYRTNRGFRSTPSTGISMAMGPAGGFGAVLFYATYAEFGTVDTPAFGYMRGAWDAGAQPALEYIKDNLWTEIDKATKRLAKRLAKAA